MTTRRSGAGISSFFSGAVASVLSALPANEQAGVKTRGGVGWVGEVAVVVFLATLLGAFLGQVAGALVGG